MRISGEVIFQALESAEASPLSLACEDHKVRSQPSTLGNERGQDADDAAGTEPSSSTACEWPAGWAANDTEGMIDEASDTGLPAPEEEGDGVVLVVSADSVSGFFPVRAGAAPSSTRTKEVTTRGTDSAGCAAF